MALHSASCSSSSFWTLVIEAPKLRARGRVPSGCKPGAAFQCCFGGGEKKQAERKEGRKGEIPRPTGAVPAASRPHCFRGRITSGRRVYRRPLILPKSKQFAGAN